MTSFIALLRAVNVGGTGRLPMADLRAMCAEAGFADVRTYIASGNVVLRSEGTEAEVGQALETRLHAYAGRPVGVLVRTAAEMAAVLAANPFPEAPGNRVMAIFLDAAPAPDALADVTGRTDEELGLGAREVYVRYGAEMGRSRLRIPAARTGTARNMNTVARLAEMSASR